MKGQDVMTSNVACHAMLWTENSNEHPKTRDQQKHGIEIPQKLAGLIRITTYDSSERLNFFDCEIILTLLLSFTRNHAKRTAQFYFVYL